jgi:micrococcal nuclease
MRKLLSIIFFCCALLLSNEVLARESVVKKIIDGNTIQLDTGEIVKYIGIEAPEINLKEGRYDFFAKEAKKYNHKLVFLKKVHLEFDKEQKDKEGRTLAYVYVKKIFVNAELVKLGYAKVTSSHPNEKYKTLFLEYEKKAIASEKGLWQEQKKDTEISYIGNKRTYTFHRPSCKSVDKISEKSKIIFRNRSDAIKIGYTPDKGCKP